MYLLLMVTITDSLAREPELAWVAQFKGSAAYSLPLIETDQEGNIYMAVSFDLTFDANPTVINQNLVSKGFSDIGLLKLDSNGNLLWAISFGGSRIDHLYDMELDDDGSIFLAGIFYGTIDFDPGPGTENVLSYGDTDGFFAKFNSYGGQEWAKRIGGPGADVISDIELSQGNVVISGYFSGTADFNPGTDRYELFANGPDERFIAKYGPNGELIFAKEFGIIPFPPGVPPTNPFYYLDEHNSLTITTADNGDILLAGSCQGFRIDLYPGQGILSKYCSNMCSYILRLDSEGNFQEHVEFEGYYMLPTMLRIAPDDNLVSVGRFDYLVDFDPGPNYHVLEGAWNLLTAFDSLRIDNYVSTLDPNMNFLHGLQIGGYHITQINDAEIDKFGFIYLAGKFDSLCDFDPGNGVHNVWATGVNNGFVCKISQSGNLIWVINTGGDGDSRTRTNSISIGPNGAIYEAGSFTLEADFDPGQGNHELDAGLTSDIYLRKLNNIVTGLPQEDLAKVKIFPNPSNGLIIVEKPPKSSEALIRLYDPSGTLIMERVKIDSRESIMINGPSGIYYLEMINSKGEKWIKKILKN